MSNAKITHTFVTQEAVTEQALSPKNPDSGVAEKLSHALQQDSPQTMSSKHEGFAVSAQLLGSPCQYVHNRSHFPIFDNTEGALFFRHSICFALRSEPALSHGSPFLTADVRQNPRAPAVKVYRFSFPFDIKIEGMISGG